MADIHKKLNYSYHDINTLLAKATLSDKEPAERKTADNELQAQINAIKGNSSESIESLKSSIDTSNELIAQETSDREQAIEEVKTAIDEIDARSDVVDIVASYADLEEYTKKLTKDDVVKVLVDEEHDNYVSYYKVDKASKSGETKDWTYIASIDQYELKTNHDTDYQNLRDALSTETSNRDDADNELQTNIDTEHYRAQREEQNLQTNIDAKQDIISDLPTIRSNAESGVSAKDALNGHTINSDVPANAIFTDTTYTAGENIEITDNTISAKDTLYFAGDQISIDASNKISASPWTITIEKASQTGTILEYGQSYKLTAGGSSIVFTMPAASSSSTSEISNDIY